MKKSLTILLLFISFNLILSQKIERIEPANWWVGMKNNSVTLLIYGKDISDLQPAISYPGITITENKTVENKNYLFLTLQINPDAKAGTVKIKFSKDNKVVLTKDFPIYAREANSANRVSYGSKDAILLIVPDRFSNGNEKMILSKQLWNKSLTEIMKTPDTAVISRELLIIWITSSLWVTLRFGTRL